MDDLALVTALRDARREDRGALGALRATDVDLPRDWRARRTPYEGWWEVQAQSLVRGLRPPLPPKERLLLATRTTEAGEQILGAMHYEVDDGEVEIRVAVVGVAWHRQGLGSLLLGCVLDLVWEVAGDITAVAHESNTASRALLEAHRFTLVQCQAGWALYALVAQDRIAMGGSAPPSARR